MMMMMMMMMVKVLVGCVLDSLKLFDGQHCVPKSEHCGIGCLAVGAFQSVAQEN